MRKNFFLRRITFTLYCIIMQLYYVLQKNKDTLAKDHHKYPYYNTRIKGRLKYALSEITVEDF